MIIRVLQVHEFSIYFSFFSLHYICRLIAILRGNEILSRTFTSPKEYRYLCSDFVFIPPLYVYSCLFSGPCYLLLAQSMGACVCRLTPEDHAFCEGLHYDHNYSAIQKMWISGNFRRILNFLASVLYEIKFSC